jgi:starch phosphorylase
MNEKEQSLINNKSSIFFTDGEASGSYSISNQFAENLEFRLVRDRITASGDDAYFALSLAVRDRLVRKWLRTQRQYYQQDVKRVYYLSLEYLMGRLLGNALINMDYYNECYKILKEDGYSLEEIRDFEHDMGLGNGGLGRLAACYLDSMATLELPAFGYGIRYEYGIFEQEIENGFQVEYPDNWLSDGNPWDIMRRRLEFRVKFYGKTKRVETENGEYKYEWIDTEDVLAMAYDVPVPGYGNNTVNNLRLWEAKACKDFSFKDFNAGNYVAAVSAKTDSETISKVLYPNDSYLEGKFLRLKQQYFFVSATLQDIIRKYKINHDTFDKFADKTAIQLNDTHPVIAIPELMRILIDEENFSWNKAWEITSKTFAYTNHTVVPEALEEWSLQLFEELLPRHIQIVHEINRRFLEYVKANYTTDEKILNKLSIIKDGTEKTVRMANLAIVGSFAVNGVAALHTEIIKTKIFHHFNKIYPTKFLNITNGITQRRWLKTANPFLSNIITDKIGDVWLKDLEKFRQLESFIDDESFLESWRSAVPRTVIFGGKAAPAYFMAKLIIKLINSVADIVNNDPDVGDKLKVIFLKNYSVTLAEKIIPASDLSEQISMAGLEASGTGNMKFALNGALTIGTMDGANIEIREEVGEENIFIFGLLADDVVKLKENGYNPVDYYEGNKKLKKIIDMISSDYFNPDEPGIFQPIIEKLLNDDYYCLLADYQSYIDAQDKVSELYMNTNEWTKKTVLNVARIAKFSSDRSIKEYAEKIWNVEPVKIIST